MCVYVYVCMYVCIYTLGNYKCELIYLLFLAYSAINNTYFNYPCSACLTSIDCPYPSPSVFPSYLPTLLQLTPSLHIMSSNRISFLISYSTSLHCLYILSYSMQSSSCFLYFSYSYYCLNYYSYLCLNYNSYLCF